MKRVSLFLAMALTVWPIAAEAAYNRGSKPLVSCDSPMLQELMAMPVVEPRRDLGFALYVLDELDVRPPPCRTECLPIEPYHLVDYLENLWFDDVLAEPLPSRTQ